MDKPIRFATNDRVEIIDNNSPYFGKTGKVKGAGSKPLQMIGFNSKTISSTIIYYVVVKLDEIEITQEFAVDQVRKIS